MTSTGVQMLMKAIGFDPQVVIEKAQELEQLFMTFGAEVQSKVSAIDERLTRIETMLAEVLVRQQQQCGPIQAAGECSPELYIPPAETSTAVAVQHTEERKPNGRYTGNRGEVKGPRKSN